MALQSFQDRWSRASGVAHEFNHVFGCEFVPDKTAFDMTVSDHAGHSDSCMFVDVSDLEGVFAWCDRHKSMCRVPDAEGLVAGLSCNDLSKMSSKVLRGRTDILCQQGTHKYISKDMIWLSWIRRHEGSVVDHAREL